MSTLLIRHIAQLVTCDDSDRILQDADLYCENVRECSILSAGVLTS